MSKHAIYWMGRPITELSREELIEVIQHLANDLRRHNEPENIRAHAIGKARMFFESATQGAPL